MSTKVTDHGTVGDGSTDDRAAILTAIGALDADRTLIFPRPSVGYKVSKFVPIQGIHGLRIVGEGAPKILHPSADSGVTAPDGIATSNAMARSGLLLSGCDDVLVDGMQFEGSSSEVNISVNVGCGIYLTNCARARVAGVRQVYGGAMLQQEPQTGDVGLRVRDCHSYGVRGNTVLGPDSAIDKCVFELPIDVGYHRSGNNGSSHAIYLYAGRSRVKIRDCVFKNIRTTGIKVSGSSVPIRDLLISGCHFDDCGSGIVWGADDAQEHTGAIIEGNDFLDCATNVSGWTDGAAIVVYGSDATVIRGNILRYARACLGTVSAVKGIQVQTYTGGRQCRRVLIEDSSLAPDAILTQALYGWDVDEFVLRDNVVIQVGNLPLYLNDCPRAIVDGLDLSDPVTMANVLASAGVILRNITTLRGAHTSNSPLLTLATSPNITQDGNFVVASDGSKTRLAV